MSVYPGMSPSGSLSRHAAIRDVEPAAGEAALAMGCPTAPMAASPGNHAPHGLPFRACGHTGR
eukprot:5458867-Pyramimonas_sp.AAC.1